MRVVDITDQDLRKMLSAKSSDIEIIDVREPFEYAIIRFSGSRLVPLRSLLQGYVKLDSKKRNILVCRTGSRSRIAGMHLMQDLKENIYNLKYGIAESYHSRNTLLEYGEDANIINNYLKQYHPK